MARGNRLQETKDQLAIQIARSFEQQRVHRGLECGLAATPQVISKTRHAVEQLSQPEYHER